MLNSNWKCSMVPQTNKPDKHFRLSHLNQTKLCDKKVNTTQFDWATCAGSTYIFCVAVTKIAKFVMIAHSLCAVPAHWAMVTEINCAIVGDTAYSVYCTQLWVERDLPWSLPNYSLSTMLVIYWGAVLPTDIPLSSENEITDELCIFQ